MEIADMGAFFNGEWESLSNVYTFDDELGFGTHKLLSHPTDSTFVAPFIDNEYFYDNNLFCNSHINNFSFENNHFSLPNDEVYPMNLSMIDQGINHASTTASPIGSVEDNESYILASTHDTKVRVKRKKNGQELLEAEEKIEVIAKKKTKVSNKNGNRRIESTENKEDDESNVGVGNKSDEESIASIGKKRASRGTATDPQSLYARRRREKINERLKILQNLVPNGTKVDISTMLEEAVQYVKFLQLQIRLLSSDDLWMYAPLAYNGVDINLYQRISPFLIP